ncbi:MAG: L-dopachrome tautomerase-related protein [Phycisphaerae bacterium]|nr:L-dopachrome tautomerase-related protein [Phycisphaerae bacterium]
MLHDLSRRCVARLLVVLAMHVAPCAAAHAQHGMRPTETPAFPQTPSPIESHGDFATVTTTPFTPGNVALTPHGRMFLSFHPFGDPEVRVAEVLSTGALRAYPTPDWSRRVPVDGANAGIGIQSIIGIKSDVNGVLWMLDAGNLAEPNGTPPKLIAWDTTGERLVRVIHIPPPISKPSSFLQDMVIDSTRDVVFIADSGTGAGFAQTTPAIVVVYLKTGVARRVLENAPCVQAEPDAAMIIDGREITVTGADGSALPARVGINPITMDNANEWVYFGAMHGKTVWKIRAADLANPGLSSEDLAERVQKHGTKPVSDGFSIDSAGNIYVTDVGSNAIGVVAPDGTYRILHQDDAILSWPDGMSAGSDGAFYVVVNQLHRHPPLNGGANTCKPPFRVVRFEPLAPASVGR